MTSRRRPTTTERSYETPQPWEQEQGSLRDRVVRVSHEAQRVYQQQIEILPTLQHEQALDPARGQHLQDVGRHVQILREQAQPPDKLALKVAEKTRARKRVVPSRYADMEDMDSEEDEQEMDIGEANGEGEDVALLQGRIETMLMDQEWDTHSWNKAKLQAAIEALCVEIESASDHQRRELATTMLRRLLETHEPAVEVMETTLPILMNKAFRNLSSRTDNTRIFRVAALVAVLAEWFAALLGRENAVNKCISFLGRELELCARILQHHWRGVLFERTLRHREYNAEVRARLRAMHLIKNVELRHQFKVLRTTTGPMGLPLGAIQSYVRILRHLVQPSRTAIVRQARHHVTADQKRLLTSGLLVYLAALIPARALPRMSASDAALRRLVIEDVKVIARELAESFEMEVDKIIAIMKANVIQRVLADLELQLRHHLKHSQPLSIANTNTNTFTYVKSALNVVSAIARAVWHLARTNALVHASEAAYVMKQLQATATQFLTTSTVLKALLHLLTVTRQCQEYAITEQVLILLRHLANAFGYAPLLCALVAQGGRALEQVLLCFLDVQENNEHDDNNNPATHVVLASVALFSDMTSHADARGGFTTAGALGILARHCGMGIENLHQEAARRSFLVALIAITLLARQTHAHAHAHASADALLASLGSVQQCLHALYSLLLELVEDDAHGGGAQRAARYLHGEGVLVPIVLRFLRQVQPHEMEPALQSAHHRNISCIVLGRFFAEPSVAQACFSELTVNHLALSLQCCRLDVLDHKLQANKSTTHERVVHALACQEACKALSRLAKCPADARVVDLSLRASLTSSSVPPLPQAIVCDVMLRLHALEGLLPLIHLPTDAAEFAEIEVTSVLAAVELVGYLRPMPYGEDARQGFLKRFPPTHPQGQYARSKLTLLVEVAAPVLLHVLREKRCGSALVSACCSALSRLAATTACCALLLDQGCLFIALTHLPEVLCDVSATASPSRQRHPPRGRSTSSDVIVCDATVHDLGLLEVPASLFTLLAKLCTIEQGRLELMKALVLPRVLKRLQLTDHRSDGRDGRFTDVAVKSEIALVVQRVAMTNATEGNTSELFLHFHALESLARVLQDELQLWHDEEVTPLMAVGVGVGVGAGDDGIGNVGTTNARSGRGRVRQRHRLRNWRVLHHVTGAIAALAEDVLVCVPTLVKMDMVAMLAPFLSEQEGQPESGAGARTGAMEKYHRDALQYHVMAVIRAIASYPCGEFHGYLTASRAAHAVHDVHHSTTTLPRSKTSQPRGDHTGNYSSVSMDATDRRGASVMDRVKKIGHNFTLELQNCPTSTTERTSIGQLARETLAFVNERKQQLAMEQQVQEHRRQQHAAMMQLSPVRVQTTPRRRNDDALVTIKDATGVSPPLPVLPRSPLRDPAALAEARLAVKSSTNTMNHRVVSPNARAPATVQISGYAGGSPLSGIDLRMTRPPGSPTLTSNDHDSYRLLASKSVPVAMPVSSTSPAPYYTFARPKPTGTTQKSHRVVANNLDDMGNGLMLDPLFQNTNNRDHRNSRGDSCHESKHPHPHQQQQEQEQRSHMDELVFETDRDREYAFRHETSRVGGHSVTMRARRSRAGDKYIPSLGQIQVDDLTLNALR